MTDVQPQPVKLPATLAEWRDWLCDKEMPIFSSTARRIGAIVEDAKAGATELAHVVMADPGLAAKVLKLSNSAYYNTSHQAIGTLTKAVILLGAKVINELALTASYVEAIQSAHNRGKANREIVDALHAALQAKSFALLCRDPDPEEVFLATLLYNIGHVAFWCFAEQIGEKIDRLVQFQGFPEEEAQRQVLGFPLRELGAALAKAWQLKGLIAEVHQYKGAPVLRIRLVQIAYEAVKFQQRGSLDSERARALLAPLVRASGKTTAELIELIKANSRTALTLSQQYGVDSSAALPQAGAQVSAAEPLETRAARIAQAISPEERQLALQRIQQDIASQLAGAFDLNLLFEMIIEGIQRGIPMDRTLFALFNPERTALKEKSAIGWPSRKSRSRLEVPVFAPERTPNIFTYALQGIGSVWIQPKDGPKWGKLYTPEIESQFGRYECFIAPLALNGRAVGVFYASRALSGVPLDQEAFNTFSHLAQQANFGLKLSQLPS